VCKYNLEDCSARAKVWTITQGSKKHILEKCPFRPQDEHPNDLNQFPGYMAGGYIKQLVPTDKDNRAIDPPSKLWANFHIPTSVPYAYGVFCEQYSWFDTSSDTKQSPPYDGAWRYDNETWVIVRDISTCPCFPACSVCEERLPGTKIKQVKEDGGECLSRYGVTPSQCENVIIGVSGGPAVFPPETTGLELDDFGEPQVCFSYSNIKGRRLKGPDALPTIRSAAWGKVGVPADNPIPPGA